MAGNKLLVKMMISFSIHDTKYEKWMFGINYVVYRGSAILHYYKSEVKRIFDNGLQNQEA